MKIPKNLGRYEVLDLISQGGMGTLFRARDPRIGRYVAVKVLKKDFDTPELRDRFSREARAAGCLSHPNIVTIYDVGEHEGLPFIAMEYVRGETFAEVINLKPPLPVERKLQLMEEVCAGLAHAHEAGIVHRDIKPANLILSSEGLVKILDFGIAKLSSAGLTMPGVIMGTLNYMSPEQAKGDPVDARTDVFAVGVVMYELLSHQPAFSGTRASEVLHRILSGSPTPITDYCPDLDARIVQLIDRAIEKNPDRRFQTIADVQHAIEDVRVDMPVAGGTRTRPTRQTRSTASRASADPARVRAEQIEGFVSAAEQAFESGDYDAAIEACKQVLMLDASNERAFAELDRIHAAADERQAAVQAAVDRGRAAFRSGDVSSALREAKQALALDPYDPDARALSAQAEEAIAERQEDARVRGVVDSARRRFAEGEHDLAIQALAALPASHPYVRSALDELRRELGRIEEQRRLADAQAEVRRRIAAMAADGRAAVESARLDDANRIVSAIRDLDAAAPELADLSDRVRAAYDAVRVREEVGRILAEFDVRLANGQLDRAAEQVTAAAALSSTDPRIPAARNRLSQAQATADARRREGDAALDRAAAKIQVGDLDGVEAILKRASDLVPGDARAADLSEQLRLARERQAAEEAAARLKRKVDELVRSAAAHLESGADQASKLPVALHDVSRALELDPSSVEAADVKKKIEAAIVLWRETARARAAIDNAARRFAMGKHQAAIKLLEEFDPPAQPDVVKALADLRGALQVIEERRRQEKERVERQQRAAALVEEARAALDAQQFDAALARLADAEKIDPPPADIAPLREQIVREQEASRRRSEASALIAQIDGRVQQGDYTAASQLLAKADALGADAAAVADARQRINGAVAEHEAAVARERETAAQREAAAEREAAVQREAAAAREREAAAARDREAAAARQREAETRARQIDDAARMPALTSDPDAETMFAGDLQEAVRAALAAAGHDAPHAPANVPPSNPAPVETDANSPNAPPPEVSDARRQADEQLAAARTQLNGSPQTIARVTAALEHIEKALATVPNDPNALALETTANETLAALRDAARIDAAVRNARSRFAIGKHQAAIQLLESLEPSSHPPVADALRELRAALQEIENQRKQSQAGPKPRPQPDDDATRVIFVPEMIQSAARGGGAPSETTREPPPPAAPVASRASSAASADSNAESQRRLFILGGVLLLALIVALLLLRFAA